jgi:hypothetical protein
MGTWDFHGMSTEDKMPNKVAKSTKGVASPRNQIPQITR